MGHFRGDKIVDPEHSVHIQDEDDWEIHKSPALFSKGMGVGFPLYMAVWGKPDPTVCVRVCVCVRVMMSVFAADEEHQARLAEQLMQDRERQRQHEKSREMELDWERKHKREMQEDQIVEAQIERQIARDRQTTEHLSHLPDWRVALAEGAASASHAAHMGDDPKIKGAPPKSSPRVSFANHRTRLPDSDIPSRGDDDSTSRIGAFLSIQRRSRMRSTPLLNGCRLPRAYHPRRIICLAGTQGGS